MDLHVMGMYKAVEFVPSSPAYAIRIFSSSSSDSERMRGLKKSDMWVHVAEYVFDDVWPELLSPSITSQNPVLFTPEMADSLVKEFAQYVNRCQSLLVHCSMGKNRSPAVAIGLNESFNLGQDTDELQERFSQSNRYVCRLVAEAGYRYLGKDPSVDEIKTVEELNTAIEKSGLNYMIKATQKDSVGVLGTDCDADEKRLARISRKSGKYFSAHIIGLSGGIDSLKEYGFDLDSLTPEQTEKLQKGWIEILRFEKK